MALFPSCSFEVLLTGGVFVPGTRAECALLLDAAEPIPRADHIDLAFRTRAWAAYGSGKRRRLVRRDVFHAPFRFDVPSELPPGRHRFPFTVDVPAWLPPGYRGEDCAIEHTIETRLDVDWAVDPTSVVPVIVEPAPEEGTRAALAIRSPRGFHPELSLEVTLASSVIALGEPLVGQVALRSGHSTRFDGLHLAFGSVATITMAKGDARRSLSSSNVHISAEALRQGKAVLFAIEPDERLAPSFRSPFIDHEPVLRVTVDTPWLSRPTFVIPLQVLPRGSTLHGEATAGEVGSERLRGIASAMATATGLHTGRMPTLVEGDVGPVTLRLGDAPRGAGLGIDVDLTFPDLGLGITFRRLALLEGFRASPLLPVALAKKHLLRCRHEGDAALRSFFDEVLDDVEIAEEVRLSDHHLAFRLPIPDDDPERMVQIAQITQRRAKILAEAIGRLPFPAAAAAAQPAWLATAREQDAFLVPTGPSLHGLTFRARVLGGEERVATAVVRTEWTGEAAFHHVDVDLGDATLPAAACAELEDEAPTADLGAVRRLFSSAHALADGRGATLQWDGFAADPRVLLPAIEAFFAWVLDKRGERRTDLPYR